MRLSRRVALLALALAVLPRAGAQPLAGFGTNDFTIDESYTTAPHGQGPTTLTLDAPFTAGEIIGGDFKAGPYDWSGIASFGLLMSAPGPSPTAAFTFYLLDSLDAIINTYEGSAAGLGNEPTAVDLILKELGTDDLTAVNGMVFTWESAGTSAVILNGIVPEPSTWALALFAALFCGGVLWRRRHQARREG